MDVATNPIECVPPGEFIRRAMDSRGWLLLDLAAILGRSPANVGELVAGKRVVSTEIAIGLAAAFGNTPEYWLDLEKHYQLCCNRNRPASDVARRARLYAIAPVREMLRRGWLDEVKSLDELEAATCRFFGVQSLDDPIPSIPAAARKSTSYQADFTPQQRAWLVRVRQLASAVHAIPFSASRQAATIEKLRCLTHEPKEARHVPRVLADAGIRYVVVEPLAGVKIDGACLWLDEGPVVAMSLRFDRIDNFWFCLFHELHHVYHRVTSVDDELGSGKSGPSRPACEIDADDFAMSNLVDPAALESFIMRKRPLYSRTMIEAFAKTKGVHPGVVVGLLQWRGELQWAHMRALLAPVRDAVVSSALTDGWGSVVPGLG